MTSKDLIKKNKDRMWETYTLLTEMLYEVTSDANETSDYDALDATLETVDKISTILKRLGDTVVIDASDNTIVVDNNAETEVGV